MLARALRQSRADSPVRRACIALLAILLASCGPASERTDDVQIAVAANFLAPLRALEAEFERTTEHDVVVIAGSTGQLYAQILNGAPFDVLLAADQERPRLLAERGAGISSSVFTYAVGRLALWSRAPRRIDEALLGDLASADFRWLAIANPALAPYGAAAEQTLEALGVRDALASRLVMGQSIAQTFALVETRNADLGFIALSQALEYGGEAEYMIVPDSLHEPIRQDAIVLERGGHNPAVHAFVEFLRSSAAATVIERYGYTVPGSVQ